MKTESDRLALNEAEMLAEFRQEFNFPPLRLRLCKAQSPPARADAVVETEWEGKTLKFLAEFKSRSSPLVFRDAIRAAQDYVAETSDYFPMIVVPYLRSKQLEELQQLKVSGLDLSGNGIVIIPNNLLVYRTGNPNQFPESATTKYAYRGTTSLVARAFLCRASYEALAQIEEEIRKRGANVAISTISKAIKRMEQDLVVERRAEGFYVLQPDEILQNLARSYQPPKIRRKVTCATDVPLGELAAQAPSDVQLALCGRSSIAAYAVMGRDDRPCFFTSNIDLLLEAWAGRVQETSRFATIEVQETLDPLVYFDLRPQQGLPYASPIQVFLECAVGDKRERETAQQVRADIVRELLAQEA
ncbi:MAG: hypothetical protein K8T91_26395 [Planctomycetes bacterium]|nr:hypothetical protein [Planctomycetota bacterium]